MTRRVIYLMSGVAHMPYLLVSLHSLRKVYDGDVEIYAYPNSIDMATAIASSFDDVEARLWEPIMRDEGGRIPVKNRQFINKIKLMQTLPAGSNCYLDADTMPVRPIDVLFEDAEGYGFCATQFNGWVTTGRIISKRIKRLIDREPIDQKLVQRALNEVWPSVNGGIFACRPDSLVLPLWEQWTLAVRGVFIADETVLHMMMVRFVRAGQFAVLPGGRWNSSPKYQNPNLPDSEVVIWHFHGDSNVRPNTKSPKGYELWWPVWKQCVRNNIGNVRDWMADAVAANKFMKKLEQPKWTT